MHSIAHICQHALYEYANLSQIGKIYSSNVTNLVVIVKD